MECTNTPSKSKIRAKERPFASFTALRIACGQHAAAHLAGYKNSGADAIIGARGYSMGRTCILSQITKPSERTSRARRLWAAGLALVAAVVALGLVVPFIDAASF